MSDERHGVPSCSILGRLEACPASWHLSRGLQSTAGPDAESGTRIHRWLETAGSEPDLDADEQGTAHRCYSQELDVFADWAMDADHESFRELRLGLTLSGEVIDVTPETTEPLLYTGRADLIVVQGHRALIIDYKTGRGDTPEAADNPQMRGLARLVGGRFRVSDVTVCIIQPWVGQPTLARFDDLAIHEAGWWVRNIVRAATSDQQGEPHPGDHCQFCPANGRTCQKSLSEMESLAVHDDEPALVHISLLSNESVGKLLSLRQRVKWTIETIEHEARTRLERGEDVPGWTLETVQGRREVTDPQAAFNALAPHGLTADDMLGACKASATKLEAALRERLGCTTKAAKATLESALGDILARSVPTTKLVKKRKELE